MNADTIDLLVHRELPAATRGDRDAYGRIVAACQNAITAIALAITRDVSISEDIAQDAFLSAWQKLRRLKNPASFLPWLRQITRNLARDHHRGMVTRPMDGVAAELAIAHAADPSATPMQRLIDDERDAVAAELIAALPEDSREILLLYYREGCSSQQVAALLGMSDAAVRKRLSRARKSVREGLLQRFADFARDTAPGSTFAIALMATLGAVSKPVAAATGTAIGASVGASVGSKALAGGAGLAGAAGAGLVLSSLTIWMHRRALSQFPATDDERRALLRLFDRWFVWGGLALCVVAGGVGALAGRSQQPWSPWFPALALLILGVFTYPLLTSLPRLMHPLLARDAARDPVGAPRRALIYRLTFGNSGIVITSLALLVAVLVLYWNTH